MNLKTGKAELEANFEKDEINVDLKELAKLTGTISTNKFSGTKVETIYTAEDLGDKGDFKGSFRGRFYGPKAVEAGGVFDFTSDDLEAGEFRGSFGGRKDK